MLFHFNGQNGAHPTSFSGLVQAGDGNLYGTTLFGGSNFTGGLSGQGTVFKITTNGVLTTLVFFNGTNGSVPYGGLTLGTDQNLYGTTDSGGAFSTGTVFKVTMEG